MIKQVSPKSGPLPYTDSWYRLRVADYTRDPICVIGASEAAAAIGVSRWSEGPLELFLKKTGRIAEREDTEAMEIGRLLEDPVLTLYERRTGWKVRRGLPLFHHGSHPWMVATPDAISECGQIVVDAKTTSFRRKGDDEDQFGADGTDHLPVEYICQAQQLCAVLNAQRCDFPVLFDGRELRIYTVQRDETLIELITTAEEELIGHILADEAPEPRLEHPRAGECIRTLHGQVEDPSSVAMLTPDHWKVWQMTKELKERRKDLDAKIEAGTNAIWHALGNCAKAVVLGDSACEIKRVAVRETYYTDADAEAIRAKVGTIKRKGYEYLK